MIYFLVLWLKNKIGKEKKRTFRNLFFPFKRDVLSSPHPPFIFLIFLHLFCKLDQLGIEKVILNFKMKILPKNASVSLQ